MAIHAVTEGMTVRSLDGEKLGKVSAITDDDFRIEKGLFFKKEYLARYQEIDRIEEGEIFLARRRDELVEVHEAEARTAEPRPPEPAGRAVVAEEVRVPLAEEQLEAHTGVRETGEVRIHKDVVTEEQTIRVPVTHEEVEIERVPVEASRGELAGEPTFQSSTVTVPVREEVVEVTKRPVVREEVRVTRSTYEDEEEVTEEVRKERARVEQEGIGRAASKPDEPKR